MLQSKLTLERRLQDSARRDGFDVENIRELFEQGVAKREGSRNLLEYSGRNSLRSVRFYGRSFVGRVRSKSRDASYEVKLEIPQEESHGEHCLPTHMDCECTTSFWENDVKVRNASCHHSAAFHLALYLDNKTRRPTDTNYTGLLPKKRARTVMPFSFFDTQEGDRLLTDILLGLYVERFSQFDVDRDVLNNPNAYSSVLRALVQDERDSVQFRVLRQKEVEADSKDLRAHERKRYASIKALEYRLDKVFQDHDYIRSGYVLEFKGTSFETVAIRYISLKNRSMVYNLCMMDGIPPLLVKKNLLDKTPHTTASDDTRYDHPIARIGQRYATIDDATRREALAEVIIPGIETTSGIKTEIFVPENLRQEYQANLRKFGKEAA